MRASRFIEVRVEDDPQEPIQIVMAQNMVIRLTVQEACQISVALNTAISESCSKKPRKVSRR